MKNILITFLKNQDGQDLIEYSLLLAFVVMSSAALLRGAGSSVKGIWTLTNNKLAAGNMAAS